MGLVERVALARRGRGRDLEQRFSIDDWVGNYLLNQGAMFGYGGNTYGTYGVNTTWTPDKVREFTTTLPGYLQALRASPPAFAAEMVRALVLSQARFTFRNPPWHSTTPRRTFGSSALALLERPWPNGTTGELVSRMEWHAGLAGNAFVRREGARTGFNGRRLDARLRVLRPDWTGILHGSDAEPDDPQGALDSEVIGYVYKNGGWVAGNPHKATTLLPEDVCHWAPMPDPESPSVGMSWITAALKDIQGDVAATAHKLKFFSNGATPNMVVKGIPAASKEQFDELVDMMEDSSAGLANAYKTLYLTAGADATVVGSDLKQLDFKVTQGAGETRIALLGRVPAPILGISEGLAGSSLNAGNFGMARRLFSDIWVHPTLQDLAASLAPLVTVPGDAELWFDTSDIPLLREDGKDAADIDNVRAAALRTLWDGGADPDSAIATIAPDWVGKLKHSGLLTVQLQDPTKTPPPPAAPAPAAAPDAPAAPAPVPPPKAPPKPAPPGA